MKFARNLPKNPNLEEQIELLKRLVIINHDDFPKGTAGRIVSLLQNGMFWVLLNHPYQTKKGGWSRKRMFKCQELKLVDEK